jgi:hypothetical protein
VAHPFHSAADTFSPRGASFGSWNLRLDREVALLVPSSPLRLLFEYADFDFGLKSIFQHSPPSPPLPPKTQKELPASATFTAPLQRALPERQQQPVVQTFMAGITNTQRDKSELN